MRLSLFFLLVILFPLIQKQWLNLYLYDINNFTIYKLLYYLSGLIVPILVIINSLNKFTYYKFNYNDALNNNFINGKLLLFITSIASILLSTLISNYIFINFRLFLKLFISNNNYLINLSLDKQILLLLIISILLIFKKTRVFVKKIMLINFFIISIFIWFSQINNILIIDLFPFNIFRHDNMNYINIIYLLIIETVFYLWSYISHGSSLSDWMLPKPHKSEVKTILTIIIFYLLIMIYYSILYN